MNRKQCFRYVLLIYIIEYNDIWENTNLFWCIGQIFTQFLAFVKNYSCDEKLGILIMERRYRGNFFQITATLLVNN